MPEWEHLKCHRCLQRHRRLPRRRRDSRKYRKPSAGPTADNVQDQTLWQQLSEQSLASTQAAAEKSAHRTPGVRHPGHGRAAPERTQRGQRRHDRLADRAHHTGARRTARSHRRAMARLASCRRDTREAQPHGGRSQVRRGPPVRGRHRTRRISPAPPGQTRRRRSLLLFVATIGTWWWAPPAQPPALINITTPRGAICGTLIKADNHAFTVQQANTSGQIRIPFGTATNVQITASCLGVPHQMLLKGLTCGFRQVATPDSNTG